MMPDQRWGGQSVVTEMHCGADIGGRPDVINDGGWDGIELREIVQLLKDVQQHQQPSRGRSPRVDRRAHSNSSGSGV